MVRSENTVDGLRYERITVSNFRISQAAAIYLLQGASIRQLLSGVIFADKTLARVYSVVFSESPCLWRPPPEIKFLVFARYLETPENMSEEEILKALFLEEVRLDRSTSS